jgi:hypothetical protein
VYYGSQQSVGRVEEDSKDGRSARCPVDISLIDTGNRKYAFMSDRFTALDKEYLGDIYIKRRLLS